MEGKRPGTLLPNPTCLRWSLASAQVQLCYPGLSSPFPSLWRDSPRLWNLFCLHHCPHGLKSGDLWEHAHKEGTRASGQLLLTLSSYSYKVHTTDTLRSDLQGWREGQERKSQVMTIAREIFPEQGGRTAWEEGVAEWFCWTPTVGRPSLSRNC